MRCELDKPNFVVFLPHSQKNYDKTTKLFLLLKRSKRSLFEVTKLIEEDEIKNSTAELKVALSLAPSQRNRCSV